MGVLSFLIFYLALIFFIISRGGVVAAYLRGQSFYGEFRKARIFAAFQNAF